MQRENQHLDDFPGVHPRQVFQKLDDHDAALLLPDGAFNLVSTLTPERLEGSSKAETLANLFSIELAVDDPHRRALLIASLPKIKLIELKERLGLRPEDLSEPMDARIRRAFLGFFGVSKAPRQPIAEPGPSETVVPGRSLFPHQKRAASEVERFLYREEGRVMLHLPTGAGKTRTAMSIVVSHLRTHSPGLVLWLATTRELLEQAALEFHAAWQQAGDRQLRCLRFYSANDPPIDDMEDGIVVGGLAKLNAFGKDRERLWHLGDRTTMVVFDEAHQAVATTYRDILETVVKRRPRTPLLGLSATPGRTWVDVDLDSEVAHLFKCNKVTLDFPGSDPIAWMTAEGYLARVVFSQLNVQPGIKLSQTDLEELSNALDIPTTLAERLGNDEQRNLRIVERLRHLSCSHPRVLVFAPSVSCARLLTNVCRGIGLIADLVTGQTDAAERTRIIRDFTRPDSAHRILLNYGVLTTGFDAPSASAVVIARPTKSLVLYSQMLGRVIRGPKAGGTPTCEVVTVVDTNLPGFRNHAEAFTNWEDVWQNN
ncbi:MAG: DEAD/DEAH box helicase [Gammaproteobacteria bacterium]|nr:DEAD/DEAH box helicase [Gammaproteobacteria bacterium]